MHGSVDVAGEAKYFGRVGLGHFSYRIFEFLHVTRLGRLDDSGEGLLPTDGLILEDLVHVGSEDAHVEFIVNSTTVNCVLECSVNLLPLRYLSSGLLDKGTENLLACLQVTI